MEESNFTNKLQANELAQSYVSELDVETQLTSVFLFFFTSNHTFFILYHVSHINILDIQKYNSSQLMSEKSIYVQSLSK